MRQSEENRRNTGLRGMQLTLRTCDVRTWRSTDLDSLVKYANNRRIWINLRDRFPHPRALSCE